MTQKRTFMIVGCSSTKRKIEPGKGCRTDELYQGELFKKRAEYARLRNVDWFILSARNGICCPRTFAWRTYDMSIKQLSQVQKAEWLVQSVSQLLDEIVWDRRAMEIDHIGEVHIEIHAGKSYAEPLAGLLRFLGADVSLPVAGMGIGRQLQWYAQQTAKLQDKHAAQV